MKQVLNLVSWNINGIRSAMRRGFLDAFSSLQPDIMCLQEVKAEPDQVGLDLPGYHQVWYPAEKKGYSGTAVLTKHKPLSVRYGLGQKDHDREGRVITLEFQGCYLVTVYTPNSKRGLLRLDYRTTLWDVAFLAFLNQLVVQKPVIFCGDLNVAHQEIDIANPKGNRKNAGFTPEERAGFDRIVAHGYIDTFRHFCKEPHHYTWWSARPGVRERNIGWRIDYFCVSPELLPLLIGSHIHGDIFGSDHCPIRLELLNQNLI